MSCRIFTTVIQQITPSGDIGKKWKINIFPVPPDESIKPSHISPEKCNLQPEWFHGHADEGMDMWCDINFLLKYYCTVLLSSVLLLLILLFFIPVCLDILMS